VPSWEKQQGGDDGDSTCSRSVPERVTPGLEGRFTLEAGKTTPEPGSEAPKRDKVTGIRPLQRTRAPGFCRNWSGTAKRAPFRLLLQEM